MPENTLKHLGNCIRTARNECGLTQQELADQTGRGLRHIQNIEKGKINPSYEVLFVLIKRLGISADILFDTDIAKPDEEVKHFLGKFMACTEDERKIILKTLDCMAEQFINRHQPVALPHKNQ